MEQVRPFAPAGQGEEAGQEQRRPGDLGEKERVFGRSDRPGGAVQEELGERQQHDPAGCRAEQVSRDPGGERSPWRAAGLQATQRDPGGPRDGFEEGDLDVAAEQLQRDESGERDPGATAGEVHGLFSGREEQRKQKCRIGVRMRQPEDRERAECPGGPGDQGARVRLPEAATEDVGREGGEQQFRSGARREAPARRQQVVPEVQREEHRRLGIAEQRRPREDRGVPQRQFAAAERLAGDQEERQELPRLVVEHAVHGNRPGQRRADGRHGPSPGRHLAQRPGLREQPAGEHRPQEERDQECVDAGGSEQVVGERPGRRHCGGPGRVGLSPPHRPRSARRCGDDRSRRPAWRPR